MKSIDFAKWDVQVSVTRETNLLCVEGSVGGFYFQLNII